MEPTVFTFLSRPGDINYGGNVHGGMVMKWLDEAAYACASKWCKTICVTKYVGGIQFQKPMAIGDEVSIVAKIIYTGKTSMHIACDVYSQKVTGGEKIKNTHCVMVFVATDETRTKPVPIPKWTPITEKEIALEQYAIKLMQLRKGIEEEMQPFLQ